MSEAPKPRDEATRLEILDSLGILDTPPEEAFDDLARVASELCGTPVALVSFVDRDRQWFKARVNFAATETDRPSSFCAHALDLTSPLVIPDTRADARFSGNPLVVGDPRIRFYAGVPLRVGEGSAVGTLCVIDYVPRELSPSQLGGLRSLARHIARELGLRRRLAVREAGEGSRDVARGDLVGDFRIERALGRGGIGAVFEARGPAGERVAIKLLHRAWAVDFEIVERFAQEARILMHLRSPYVCRILDVGNLDGARGAIPFLVLEYLEGRDLADVINSATSAELPRWRDAARWAADACLGVADAHELGVVHRDLKPTNIFLARGPRGDDQVKVLDFGVAKTSLAELRGGVETQANIALGTPAYMSPEQLANPDEVGPRSDVWSMGAVLYELLTGNAPFAGTTDMSVCAAVLAHPHPPVPSDRAPAALAKIVDCCLEKDPRARFAGMSDLEDALRALAAAAGPDAIK